MEATIIKLGHVIDTTQRYMLLQKSLPMYVLFQSLTIIALFQCMHEICSVIFYQFCKPIAAGNPSDNGTSIN